MEIAFNLPLWGLIVIGIASALACIACVGLEIALMEGAKGENKIRWQNIVIMAIVGLPAAVGALIMLLVKVLEWVFKILSWILKMLAWLCRKLWETVLYLASAMRQVKTAPEPPDADPVVEPQLS